MKLHRPVAQACITALGHIFSEGYHADKVIERELKAHREFGARDRRFLAETVYEIVRWWRLLWTALDREPSPEALWSVLGAWLIIADKGELPPWREFADLDPVKIRGRLDKARSIPAARESVPDWLYERGKEELGAKWDGFLSALNETAPVILRANRLRTDRDGLLKALKNEGIEVGPAEPLPDGVRLIERKNVFATEAFKKGLFEVQDGASQHVAVMLAPQPGERVIDACAGAGGKTLHIAAMMKNKGKILALDPQPKKLEELRRRAARAGVDIVETKEIESSKTIKRLEGTADRLLLDVPCSGLGVLRRNPDKKWKLTNEDVERLMELQSQLLDSYTKMLKPGGRLVYATCSILPSENERQVEGFLQRHEGQYRLLEERTFVPGEHGFDGFYAASLEKIR